MVNFFIISGIIILLAMAYASDYRKGFYGAVFFLLVMPKNLSIDLSIVLPSFTVHRLIILLMLGAWFRNKDIRARIDDIPFLRILLLITAASGASVLLSAVFLVSIKRYMYFVFESLVFYVITVSSLKKEGSVLPLVKTVSAAMLVLAVMGVVERYSGFNPTDLLGMKQRYGFEPLDMGDSGVEATYGHRILFGIAMAVGTMYFLFLTDRVKTSMERTLSRLSAFLAGAALYFSMSRGPWLAFIISALFVTMLFHRPMVRRLLILACMVSALVVIRPGIFLTIENLYVSTLQGDTAKGSSYRWRYQVLSMAYSKVAEPEAFLNAIFGYGQGSYAFLEFPTVRLSTGRYAHFYSWDNEYAVVLLEQGFVGLILMLLFYFSVLKRGISYYFNRRNGDRDIMLLSMSGVVVAVFMRTNVAIFAPQLVYLEFVNIALAGALLSGGKPAPLRRHGPGRG